MSPSNVELGRKITLLLGLWAVSGLAGGLFSLLSNLLPRYVASTARPGSLVVMHIVASIPWALGTLVAGAAAAVVLPVARRAVWLNVLALLIILQYLSVATYGWHWNKLNADDRVGAVLTGILLAAAFFLGYGMGHAVGPAENAAA